ncbi:NADH dehydrogenase ubiquinone complex I, assembly factor-like protein, partial [Thalictrum thalictroides]
VHVSEVYKPIQDPLIGRCIEIINLDKDNSTMGSSAISTARSIWSKVFPKPRRSWIPTGCLKLLEVLHGALPKMSLIASDFSYLPDVSIPGERAPLVSTKKDGKSSDLKSYLDAK